MKASTKQNTLGPEKKRQKRESNKGKQPKVNMKDQQIKKKYLKSKNACKVTFRMSREAASDAHHIYIAGDFNKWSVQANPMKRLKNGDFTTQVELQPGRDYQFRYHIDNNRWENDWQADKYVPNPFGDCDNSVVVV